MKSGLSGAMAEMYIYIYSVATGYGLPPSTLYDWTLSPPVGSIEAKILRLSEELEARLRIEKFCDKVTSRLYRNDRDPVGLAGEDQRATMTSFLAKDFEELEGQLGPNISSRFIQYGTSLPEPAPTLSQLADLYRLLHRAQSVM